jgi:hypothetical protein
MFPMTITLQNPAQLNAVLAALNLGTAEPTTAEMGRMAVAQGAKLRAEADAPKEVATSTAGKSAKADPARTSPTAKAAEAGAPEKTADASAQSADSAAAEPQASTAATEAVTYDQVGKAITERAKTDRAHVIATLKSFNVAKGPELKPAQYADFMKALG